MDACLRCALFLRKEAHLSKTTCQTTCIFGRPIVLKFYFCIFKIPFFFDPSHGAQTEKKGPFWETKVSRMGAQASQRAFANREGSPKRVNAGGDDTFMRLRARGCSSSPSPSSGVIRRACRREGVGRSMRVSYSDKIGWLGVPKAALK